MTWRWRCACGDEVTLAGERGDWHALFEASDLNWMELPLKGGPFAIWRSANQLTAQLKREPVDLIHCHYRRASLVAHLVQKKLNLPVVFTLHLPDIPIRGWRRRWSYFGDVAHAPSSETRQWLIEEAHLPAEQIALIPHGVDTSYFSQADTTAQQEARQTLGLPADCTVAAYVGRFESPKCPMWMLDLAEQAVHELPELHIVLIGGGPDEPALRKRMSQARLTDRVTLLPTGDPRPVYRACDALLLPSACEGFSLVCAEAMSMGRPILRTRVGGWHEQVIEKQTGQSTPVDRNVFVATALEMLKDRRALAKMGTAAAEHIRQHLTFEQQFQQTLALYRRAIQSRRPLSA